jgi:hypothetical protein
MSIEGFAMRHWLMVCGGVYGNSAARKTANSYDKSCKPFHEKAGMSQVCLLSFDSVGLVSRGASVAISSIRTLFERFSLSASWA